MAMVDDTESSKINNNDNYKNNKVHDDDELKDKEESLENPEIDDIGDDNSTQSSHSRKISKIFEQSQGDGYDFIAQLFGKMMNNDHGDINDYVEDDASSSDD